MLGRTKQESEQNKQQIGHQIGDTCFDNPDYHATIKAYNSMLLGTDSKATRHIIQGNHCIHTGSYLLAADKYEKAICLEPQNTHAYLLKSYALRLAGRNRCYLKDYASAFEYYSQAMRLNPKDPEICCDLASLYLLQAEYDKAIQHINAASKMLPDYRRAYYILAQIYYRSSHYELAIESFNSAIARSRYVDIYANYWRGMPYNALIEEEFASQDIMKMDCYYWRGKCHEALEKYELALQDYINILQIDPSHEHAIHAVEKVQPKADKEQLDNIMRNNRKSKLFLPKKMFLNFTPSFGNPFKHCPEEMDNSNKKHKPFK